MALLNNFADRDPAKFLSGMDPRHAGALLVGQIVNLRRIVNPPRAMRQRASPFGALSTRSGRRIANPPQVDNLPHIPASYHVFPKRLSACCIAHHACSCVMH